MSKDMKLIMEEWNRFVEKMDIVDMGPEGAAKLAQSIKALPRLAKINYQNMRDVREHGKWWWNVMDLLDPFGITDWPYVEDAWDNYMEWYNLLDRDPNKDAAVGDQLYAEFVFGIVLAIPLVDLSAFLASKIGLELTQGFFKAILYELGGLLAIYTATSDIPPTFGIPSGTTFHRRNIQAQKWAEDMKDIIRHGEKKQRLPLGGQKGSSKKFGTFDAKKRAVDPEYYPPQKEK